MILADSPGFRDFGGQPVAGGGRVRRGALYRSAVIANARDDDRSRLAGLGVRLVCDLRSARERDHVASFDWLCPEPSRMHCDVTSGFNPGRMPSLDALRGAGAGAAAREVMTRTYASLPTAAVVHLRALLQRLAAGELPAIIHCSAGKDRTGFFCAAVLTALGVERPAVYAEYLLESPALRLGRRARTKAMLAVLAGPDVPDEAIEVLSGVERAYLDTAFQAIDREFDGWERYLRDALGIDAALDEALRNQLVEAT